MFTVEKGETAFFRVWCHIQPEDLACSLYDSRTILFTVYSMFKLTKSFNRPVLRRTGFGIVVKNFYVEE
jgi:hypothetical protein